MINVHILLKKPCLIMKHVKSMWQPAFYSSGLVWYTCLSSRKIYSSKGVGKELQEGDCTWIYSICPIKHTHDKTSVAIKYILRNAEQIWHISCIALIYASWTYCTCLLAKFALITIGEAWRHGHGHWVSESAQGTQSHRARGPGGQITCRPGTSFVVCNSSRWRRISIVS